MSSARTVEITCPQCNKKQATEVWESVNVTVDPHLKQSFLENRLNVFTCDGCKWSGPVDVSLIYHDMTNRIWVHYVTREDMKSPEFYRSITKDGTMKLDPISAKVVPRYFSHPHFVFSMKEMVLYIIFREFCAEHGVPCVTEKESTTPTGN